MNPRSLIVAMIAIAAFMVTFTGFASDADTPEYGSESTPFAGVAADMGELDDGTSFFVSEGGEIYITLGNMESAGLGEVLEPAGLYIDDVDNAIRGFLTDDVTFSVQGKTVSLFVSASESPNHPIYGANSDVDNPFNLPEVGSRSDPLTALDMELYDLRFPRSYYYVQVGAEINLDPSYWPNGNIKEMATELNSHTSSLEIRDGGIYGTVQEEGILKFEHRSYIEDGGGFITSGIYSTIHIVPATKYVVTLDPYAEGATCATPSLKCDIGGSITLPNASLRGYNFVGWYTEPEGNGTFAGAGGSTYYVPSSLTLYAHFTEIIYTINVENAHYQIDSGGYVNHIPQFTMSDGGTTDGVTFSLVNDPLGGVLSFDSTSGRLYGYLRNVMPSQGAGHTFQIEISKDGYESVIQTVTIDVPVFTYDPLTETLETNETYSYVIEANPTDSYIEEVTVYKNDTQTTSGFTESHNQNNGKRFSITFDVEGVWEVVLLISADGCTSTTKTFTFNVTAPAQYDEDPSIDGIQIAKHPTLNGGYYFTAVNPQYYNRIQWTISDGTVEEGTDTIFHQFRTQGIFTVSCTVTNINTGKSDTASETMNSLLEVDTSNAYVNKEYAVLISNVPNLDLTLSTSPNQSWLSIDCFESDGVNYARVHGTCTNGSLVGTEVDVTIMNGSTEYQSWDLTICPDPDSQDTDFTTSINGFVVILTNEGTAGPGSVMYIDWNGDGTPDQTVRGNNTATHDYNDFGAGTYTIIVEYNYYDVSRIVNIPNITVPGNGESSSGFYLYFNSNGGSGQMAAMHGNNLTVPDCTFTNGGHVFLGWNTMANGQGDTYAPGSQIALNGVTILYALWGSDNEPDPEGDNDVLMYVVITILVIIVIVLVLRMVM